MNFNDEKAVTRLDCNHVLHDRCIQEVIRCAGSVYDAKCPLCRAPIKKHSKRTEDNFRYWAEHHRIASEWISSIDRPFDDEHSDRDDVYALQRSYGQWDVEYDGNDLESESESRNRNQSIHIAVERRLAATSPSRAQAVWQAYEHQVQRQVADSNLRAEAAWKEYDDHMKHEINEYESREIAAWLEQEHRIEIDGAAVESSQAMQG